MVGTVTKAEEEQEEVAPPPTSIAAAACVASILPRRILFHPPLKAPPPSCSAALTPLNESFAEAPLSSHANGDLPLSSKPKSRIAASPPLPNALVKRIGAGLNNLGNTCFLNSVLQCLTYTPPLAVHFQEGLHKISCRAVVFCAMCSLENHVRQALSAPGRVISPNQLVKNLRCISRSFHMGRQEDAHEYMRYLIEALQKCCPLDTHASASPSSHKNFIQRIFGGRLQSQVKCSECAHSSNTYDPFLDLSLDIVKAESLQKALVRFTAIEVLDGDNKYFCSKCRKKVRAHKQFTIDCAPHVLTVQFKRFSSTGGFGGKIDKHVQFDRTLNLTPFVNGKERPVKYSLYGVLVHSGWSTHSGHYFCFVRTSADIWHRLDDSRVSQVSERSVLEQKAYILFYIRESENLPTANGSHHHDGASNKCNVPCATNGRSKVESNGAPVCDAKAKVVDSLCMKHEESTGKSAIGVSVNGFSTANASTKNWSNSAPKGVEAFVNRGHRTLPAANALLEICEPAPVDDVERAHHSSTEVCANGTSTDGHTGKNDGPLQTNRNTNGRLILGLEKVEADSQPSLPNGFRVHANGVVKIAKANVPRWDDGEDCTESALEEKSVISEEVAHCGHVLDEWDEEYDRGKRKKVRRQVLLQQQGSLEVSDSMHKKRKKCGLVHEDSVVSILSKGGSENLFQALASEKAKRGMNMAPSKKHKQEQVLGHKLFLKRDRFKQLFMNSRHRRKR